MTPTPEQVARWYELQAALADKFSRVLADIREVEAEEKLGCACPSCDATECAAIRYGMDHWGEACQCACHYGYGDDGS